MTSRRTTRRDRVASGSHRLPVAAVAALIGMQAGFVAPVSAATATAPPAGASRAAGRLVLARTSPTASRLDGPACAPALCGWVLVSGGAATGSVPTAAAELYDPAHQSWSATASMSTPRNGHTATVLTDGRVLVAGGSSGGAATATATAELFNPSGQSIVDGATVNGSWSPAGAMVTAHSGQSATLLRDGRVLVAGGGSASTDIFDPRSGAWTAGAPMTLARTGHAATVLGDGRVLVTGGGTAGAEIYDPVTGSWTPTAPMDVARTAHTSTLLADGSVLVAGGATGPGALTANASVWSPATGAWSPLSSMTVARSAHTATSLADGRVLVVGGARSPTDVKAELWSPDTRGWTPAGGLLTSRVSHTATILADGSVLLAGGRDVNFVVAPMSETFDPQARVQPPSVTGLSPSAGSFLGGTQVTIAGAAIDSVSEVAFGGVAVDFKVLADKTIQATAPLHSPGVVDVTVAAPDGTSRPIDAARFAYVDGSWAPARSLGSARSQPTATRIALGDCEHDCDRVLVAGGGVTKAQLYDPKNNVWDDTGETVATHRAGATATLLPNGRVLLAGGATARAEVYDPGAATWSDGGTMSSSRTNHTATLLPTGKVLIAGGGTSSSELYDPGADTWSSAGDMSMARSGHTATLLPGGRVLVAGGSGPSGPSTSAEIYDPARGWTATAPMATARANHTATALSDGTVLVAGGCCDAGYRLSSSERFDPATGAWSAAGSMSQRREQATATPMVDGSVMVVGGCCDGSQTSVSTAEVYRPRPVGGLPAGWAMAPSMVDTRDAQAATLLPGGRLLVVGGETKSRGSTPSPISSAEILTTIAVTPAPTVTGVSPPVGPTTGGTEVRISGRDFVASPLSVVRFGGLVATGVNFLSTTVVVATSPPAAKGTVAVTVSNPIGVSDPTVAGTFTYAAGDWTTTGSMHQAREHQTATRLDGPACRRASPPAYCDQVLVTGGTDRFWLTGQNLDSAELYDPATGTWAETGSMRTGRFDQTATLLDGPSCRGTAAPPGYCGKVLVAGGERQKTDGGSITFEAQSSAELYDPATGNWSATGSLHVARFAHTMTLLDGPACRVEPAPGWCGKVLVAGGTNNERDRPPLASSELYDPAGDGGKGSWSVTGELDPGCSVGCGRLNHTATQLQDGRVVVAGGLGTDSTISPYAGYNVGATAQVGNTFTAGYGHEVLGIPDPNHPLRLTASTGRPRASSVSPGEEITVTWSYANVWDVPVPARISAVAVPTSADFVSASQGGVFDSQARQITFPALAGVAPNTSVVSPAGSFSVTFRIRETSVPAAGQPSSLLPDGTYLSFFANMESTNPPPAIVTTSQTGSDVQLYLSQPAAVRVAVSSDPPSGSAVKPGEQVTYRLAWFNTGAVASVPRVITDGLAPSAVDFVAASDGGIYDPSSRTVSFPAVSVPPRTTATMPGGTFTITVTVRGTAPGGIPTRPPVLLEHNRPITNTAAIAGLAANPVVHSLVQPSGPTKQPRVAVSSNPPAGSPVAGGDRVTYTISYFNSGTEAADGVVIEDSQSGGNVVATTPAGTVGSNSNLIKFPARAIPPGTTAAHPAGTLTVTVEFQATSTGNNPFWTTNTARVTDGTSGNVEQHWLGPPALRVSIAADPPSGIVLRPTDKVNYTISWFNTGPVPLEGVVVRLTLSNRLQFQSASGGGTFNPSTEEVEFAPVTVAARTNGTNPAGTATVTALVGFGVTKALSTAEIYDPVAGTWARSGSKMPTDRFGHAATLLADGRALVTGGFSAFPSGKGMFASGADLYDPAHDTWMSTKHVPNAGRGGHTATLLPDGTVLVAGGSFLFPGESPGGISGAELFDPVTETWTWAKPMISPRGVHTATLLDGPACVKTSPPPWCGAVLLAGGLGPVGGVALSNSPKPGDPVPSIAAAEIYTPSPTLKTMTPAAGPEAGGGQVTLTGGGFAGASVMFGETPAASVTVNSPSLITATVPAHGAGHVQVTVRNGGGLSATLPADPAHVYTYGGPARVSDLSARGIGETEVQLQFSAPGSAGETPPPAARYDIRQSLTPLDESNFESGFSLCGPACTFGPAKVGDPLTLNVTNLDSATTYYYALRAVNDQGLAGPVSNPASALTGSAPSVEAPAATPDTGVAADDASPPVHSVSGKIPPEVIHPVITREVPQPPVPAPPAPAAPAAPLAGATPPTTRASASPPAADAREVAASAGSWTPGPIWWAAALVAFAGFGLFAWRRYFH